MYKCYLFDLDGTLTKSEKGIMNCVKYALDWADIPVPEYDVLKKFIGPPLNYSFKEFCGVQEDKAMELVLKYRERYNDIGLFENELYDGVISTLEELKKRGCFVAAATAKPQEPTQRIFDHFSLTPYFDVIVGSTPDGSRLSKPDIIREALRQLTKKHGFKISSPEDAVMVGDRFYDIEGGRTCGIHTIGVLYGYGTRQELLEAGADHIVGMPSEILDI